MQTPRRKYAPIVKPKGRLADLDSADRVFLVKMVLWSFAGAIVGFFGGLKAAGLVGGVVGFFVGFAAVFGMARAIVGGSAAAMGQIYHPDGTSTPPVREYSQPQSLAARGLFQEAIEAYEICCAEFPDDPEPFFRIARIYLNELKRYDDAVTWFKKARTAGAIDAGRELMATQEIVDIYLHKLKQPRRAMPELARLKERFPGTQAAAWADEQMRLRRASIAREMEEGT